jgi:hypothetical protein
MTARIYIFPPERRIGFIRRQIAGVAHHKKAETKARAFDVVLAGQFNALARIAGEDEAEAHVRELARILVAHIRPRRGGGNDAGGAGGAA